MKKAERRRLKEKGIKPQRVLKNIRRFKEGYFTYNPNEKIETDLDKDINKESKKDHSSD